MRLGVCWLHVFLQGIFKCTLATITKQLTAGQLRGTYASYALAVSCFVAHSSLIEINRRIRIALAEHPSFTQLYKDILRKGVNRSNEPVTKVLPTSGAILYSVQEVLVSCLVEYVAHLFTT